MTAPFRPTFHPTFRLVLRMASRRLLAPACALLLAGAGPFAMAAAPAGQAGLPSDSIYQLPLALTGADGKARDWRGLRGKPRLLSMFYTSCPYICPLIVDTGKGVERNLTPAQRQRIGIVLVSMDPARDVPAALKKVADQRGLDPARWWLAAPPEDAVRKVAGVLGIKYRALADGEFNHASALVLVDADGRILARTERMGPIPDPAFLAAVRKAAGG